MNIEIQKNIEDKTVPKVVLNPTLYFKQPKFKGNGHVRHTSQSSNSKEYDPLTDKSFAIIEENFQAKKNKALTTRSGLVQIP